MQHIAFCSRCRGMKVGWNLHYIGHCVICKKLVSKSFKLLILTVLTCVLALAFSAPGALVFSEQDTGHRIQQAAAVPAPLLVRVDPAILVRVDPAVKEMDSFLERYKVDAGQRSRIARAIIASGRKYNIDPRLVASVMIVESRANPFAISGADAIGMMQIHLPTWGQRADKEGINLFKIEDNIEFRARILRDYIRRFGLWDGVKRYKGWNPESPTSAENVSDYVAKVQGIYGLPKTDTAEAFQ